MTDAQVYCSVKDVLESVKASGESRDLMRYIRTASQYIQRHIGQFLPILETRYIRPSDGNTIMIGPALEIISVSEDGTAVTGYEEDPYGGAWRNGPITTLERDDDLLWTEKLSVNAKWGFYLEERTLGISATQLAGDTTLAATDGGILSPGMVVGLGDEMELITAGNGGPGSLAATAATSKLDGAISADDDVITVDNGAEFHEGEVIVIGGEDIHLIKRSGHIWSVDRGWNGTSRASHDDEAAIAVYRTYSVERGVNGTSAAAHTSAAISRFMVPDDVLYLCVEMTVLMMQKAGTMFGGRAGNTNEGEAFFVNEFPTQQIEKVKSNYWLPYL